MSNFLLAFEDMIRDEGGYKLHTVEGDRGGMTYAGISRNFNPHWSGWAHIDRGEVPPAPLVREFYHAAYWQPIRGDELPQRIAASIFNFAVNSSAPYKPVVAVRLAQIVAGVTPDGAVGPKTIAALQVMDADKFVLAYALAKITRYRDIVTKNRSQGKFLLGWINRTLKGLA